MKKQILIIGISFSTMFISCSKPNDDSSVITEKPNSVVFDYKKAIVPATQWTSNVLPVDGNPTLQIVPNASLKPLNVTLSGNPMYKSNNPESITGDGWVMQNSRIHPTRGGRKLALKGTNSVYIFHINKSGSPIGSSPKYVHLIVTNPNPTAISVSAKGSYYNNSLDEKPLNGPNTGPSVGVAKDWLNNTLRMPSFSATIQTNRATQVFSHQAKSIVDARFEITTSADAFYYVVITSTGNVNDAITGAQGVPAPGDYITETANTFGREAGIYANSNVSATNDLILPVGPHHIGFALNTTNKFSATEDQTSQGLMFMNQSSSKTYANYGHKYDITFNLKNQGTTARTVKLFLASNTVKTTSTSLTFNCPIKVNNVVKNVSTRFNVPKQQLESFSVPPGGSTVNIQFFMPGLVSAGQQLIFESN